MLQHLKETDVTIEDKFERIAVALEKIASGQGNLSLTGYAPAAEPPTHPAPAAVQKLAEPTPAPRPRGRPRKVKEETPPTAEEEPVEEEETEDNFLDVTDAVAAYTIEQVREAIVGYQKKCGNPEKARKLLKTVGGVDSLRSLPEGKFVAVIEACKK